MIQDEATEAIFSRLSSLTHYTHHLADLPPSPDGPHTIYWPSPGQTGSRKVSGRAARTRGFGSVVCVNNTSPGAVDLANKVVMLFDGWRLPGGSIVTTTVGPAISDPDQRAGYCWSATVQLSYRLNR